MWRGAPRRRSWRSALLDVVEDFADEVWIGDIGDDPTTVSPSRRAPGGRLGDQLQPILRPAEHRLYLTFNFVD